MTWKKSGQRRYPFDGVGQTPDLDALPLKLADQIDQVLDASSKPV